MTRTKSSRRKEQIIDSDNKSWNGVISGAIILVIGFILFFALQGDPTIIEKAGIFWGQTIPWLIIIIAFVTGGIIVFYGIVTIGE